MSETRFKQGDVTETLVKSAERAGEVSATHAIVLLYSWHPETEIFRLIVVCSDDVTAETANWMLDKAKCFLLAEDA
jgi:hypothetical protein